MSDIIVYDTDDQGNYVDRATGKIVPSDGTTPGHEELMPQWLVDQSTSVTYPPDPNALPSMYDTPENP